MYIYVSYTHLYIYTIIYVFMYILKDTNMDVCIYTLVLIYARTDGQTDGWSPLYSIFMSTHS